jgi:acetyl-CoA acetyltransferase
MEMDPYYLAPLGTDAASFAALQARALIDAGKVTERQMAEVAARCRRDAQGNPYAQVTGDFDVDTLLAEDYVRSPLRKHDLPPITDGAVAVVIARADRARELCDNPVFISGFAHASELHYPGMRDLTSSPSTTIAAKAAGLEEAPVEVAELQSAFTHEEPVLVEALGLGPDVAINPSGGPLSANPIMATGLVRITEAAAAIRDGDNRRTLAHSTSGPCLQQNLVCILEDASTQGSAK